MKSALSWNTILASFLRSASELGYDPPVGVGSTFMALSSLIIRQPIGIRAMAGKTIMTTKFEVEKFNGKSNFLL